MTGESFGVVKGDVASVSSVNEISSEVGPAVVVVVVVVVVEVGPAVVVVVVVVVDVGPEIDSSSNQRSTVYVKGRLQLISSVKEITISSPG